MEERIKKVFTVPKQDIVRELTPLVETALAEANYTCLGMYPQDAIKFWEPVFNSNVRKNLSHYAIRLWNRQRIECQEELDDTHLMRMVFYVASPMPEIIPYGRTDKFPAMEVTLTLIPENSRWQFIGKVTKRLLVQKSVWDSFIWGSIITERGSNKKDVRKIAGEGIDVKILYKNREE